MMVVKRDGKKERFQKAKIERSLAKAGAGAHAKAIASNVAASLPKKKEVASTFIRERVIAELHSRDHALARGYSEYRKAMRNMVKHEEFLENRIVGLLGKNGVLKSVYGGFHIIVANEDEFDFVGVFKELIAARQAVRVERDAEGRLVIVTR